MVTVIGIWEDTWMEAERTERRLWKQTIQGFNVDRWIMAPSNGKVFSTPIQYDTIQEALDSVEGKKTFCVPPKTFNGIDLLEYKHPQDGIYVIGSGAESLMGLVREGDDIVSVSTPSDTDLFGVCFVPIVLYDRLIKNK